MGAPLSWVPLEFLHTQASSSSFITDQAFLPRHWFSSQLLPVSLWICGHDSLYFPVSPILGEALFLVSPTYLIDVRTVDFSHCLAFYLSRQSGDIQVPHIENQKVEVLWSSFYMNGLCLCLSCLSPSPFSAESPCE